MEFTPEDLQVIITAMEDQHIKFMKAALKEAQKAYDKKECPIGCVIVKDGKVFVRAHNLIKPARS